MIVGCIALCKFPMWKQSVECLCKHCDYIVARFDSVVGNRQIAEEFSSVCTLPSELFESRRKWNNWRWREELLRKLDSIRPEMYMVLDDDEVIEGPVKEDIECLRKNKHKQMWFNFRHPMPTEDGWDERGKAYPSKAQVKLYKWAKGQTFKGYQGRCRLSNYSKIAVVTGKSEILHYCFYNKDIRAMKLMGTSNKEKWLRERVD